MKNGTNPIQNEDAENARRKYVADAICRNLDFIIHTSNGSKKEKDYGSVEIAIKDDATPAII